MRILVLPILTSLALALLSAAPAAAQPGTPDPSFGSGGLVFDPFQAGSNVDHIAHRIAELPNERLLLAGRQVFHNAGNTSAAPLLGLLDELGTPINAGSFINGLWIHNFAPGVEQGWINRVLTLPSGEVLYCGGHTGTGGLFNGHRAVVGRLTAGLVPDLSFGEIGGQGWRRIALGLGDIDCTALEQLADGSIVIGGSYIDQDVGQPNNERNPGYFLARLDAQGQLVAGFGNNGVRVSVFSDGNANPPMVTAIAGQPDLSFFALISRDLSDQVGFATHGRYALFNPDGSTGTLWFARNGRTGTGSPYFSRLPNGELQLFADQLLYMASPVSTLERWVHSNPTSLSQGRIWTNQYFTANYHAGGSSLLGNGRSISLLVRTHEDNHAVLSLLGHGNDGAEVFAVELTSGVATPSGQLARFAAGDLIVQQNERALFAVNRYTRASGGSSVTRTRPLLRRYLAHSAGSNWSLVLNPGPISFPAANVHPNQAATSTWQTITGLSNDVQVPISVRDGEMQINFGPWTTAPALIGNGDVVRMRGYAPNTAGNSHTVRLRVGGIRQVNSWNHLAQTLANVNFIIHASQPTLPGVRCSSVGLATNCSAAIPDNHSGGVTSTLPLQYFPPGDTCNYIRSVRVGVDISHTWVGDLRVTLRDPNGQIVIGSAPGFVNLLDRPHNGSGGSAGSCTGDHVLATFDGDGEFKADDACNLVPDGAAIAGVVRPSQSLAALIGRHGTGSNGASTTGLWELTVRDLAGGDVGTLNDWSLDLSCSETPPAIADLSVAVTPPARLVGGSFTTIPFTVSNQGPAAVTGVPFNAVLPSQVGGRLRLVTWGCSASGGSSCTLPPSSCTGLICFPPIEPTLNLAAGGSATITVSGTVDELASGGETLDIDASVWIPLGLSTPADPDPSNDQVHYSQAIELDADLYAEHVEAVRFEPGRLRVFARYRNLGPSLANDMQTYLTLPSGYSIDSWTCRRSGGACDGLPMIGLGGRELTLSNQSAVGAIGNLAPFEIELYASWTGSQPSGQVTLISQHGSSSAAIDPVPANNGTAATIPTSGDFDRIFANGLD